MMSLVATELRWDWENIDTNDIVFPKSFLFGVAASDFQNSGNENFPYNNWRLWETAKAGREKSGTSCDFWHRYEDDIKLARDLGVNTFRLSIEWSVIEPHEGEFSQDALDHYRDVCQKMIDAGMTPMITFHHFTDPIWFTARGGFEKASNIKYLVRYCEVVFKELNDLVPYWCTINEPGVYAFMGYIMGEWPPEKRGITNMHEVGIVLRNLLEAHIAIFKKIKSLPGGDVAQVGFAHSVTQFEAYHDWNPLEKLVASYINHIFYKAALDFFVTGEFTFSVLPLPVQPVRHRNPTAKQALDFIGINYYSHVLVKIPTGASVTDESKMSSSKQFSAERPGDIRTDMPYTLYAEGLYRAIQEVAACGVPIMITENGCPDARDDRRELWSKRYLYALSKAIKDGYDVRGYYYWSLLDNLEWAERYTMKFGLYEVNFETKERRLRDGANYYASVAQHHIGYESRS